MFTLVELETSAGNVRVTGDCVRIVPSERNKQDKLVIGDSDGGVTCVKAANRALEEEARYEWARTFSIPTQSERGSSEITELNVSVQDVACCRSSIVFHSSAGVSAVSAMQLAPVTCDRVILACGQRVLGYKKKGRRCIDMHVPLGEDIEAFAFLQRRGEVVVGGKHVLGHFASDFRERWRAALPGAVRCVALLPWTQSQKPQQRKKSVQALQTDLAVAVGCEDNAVRVLLHGDIAFEHELDSAIVFLKHVQSHPNGESDHSGFADEHLLLFVTANGTVGVLKLSQDGLSLVWQRSLTRMREVTCVHLMQPNRLVIAAANGAFRLLDIMPAPREGLEQDTQTQTENHASLQSSCVVECVLALRLSTPVRAIDSGHVVSLRSRDVVLATYTGQLLVLTHAGQSALQPPSPRRSRAVKVVRGTLPHDTDGWRTDVDQAVRADAAHDGLVRMPSADQIHALSVRDDVKQLRRQREDLKAEVRQLEEDLAWQRHRYRSRFTSELVAAQGFHLEASLQHFEASNDTEQNTGDDEKHAGAHLLTLSADTDIAFVVIESDAGIKMVETDALANYVVDDASVASCAARLAALQSEQAPSTPTARKSEELKGTVLTLRAASLHFAKSSHRDRPISPGGKGGVEQQADSQETDEFAGIDEETFRHAVRQRRSDESRAQQQQNEQSRREDNAARMIEQHLRVTVVSDAVLKAARTCEWRLSPLRSHVFHSRTVLAATCPAATRVTLLADADSGVAWRWLRQLAPLQHVRARTDSSGTQQVSLRNVLVAGTEAAVDLSVTTAVPIAEVLSKAEVL
ncbi:MAG: hypothetical protein MHM6MM_003284 [Cercozoa sp. M6MM]